MAFNPRKGALIILNRLATCDKTLDALLDDFHKDQGAPDKRDRALMNALIYGVLRHRRRIDDIIGRFSKSGLKKIEPDVLNILRLGVHQILFMDRIPDSAAVNTAVEMAKGISAPWTVRFVNAILRKAAAGPLPAPSGPGEKYSLPDWLFSRWSDRFGKRKGVAIAKSVNAVPPITVRTNTLKSARSALVSTLSPHASGVTPTGFSPEGISFHSPDSSIPELSGFSDGLFQVQDEAAQLTGHILFPLPGESVLDACAGLGGKTGHLAQLMKNRGTLFAMDREKWKLQRLETEMVRLGVSIVTTCRHDLLKAPGNSLPGEFDRVLLDAPCSGLGVIRRNPDTKWRLSPEDLPRLSRTQYALLTQLAPLVKPGGVIVYAVCSTEPEENELVIRRFLESHPEFAIAPISPSEIIPDVCITKDGFFRSYPDALSMDGFFAARLSRSGG
jgi:16S rRNA (cytosine967-C5)-methyltransferase